MRFNSKKQQKTGITREFTVGVFLCSIAWITASLVPVAGHATGTAPVVLAVVNGDTITSTDLDNLLIATHQSMNADQIKEFDYRRLLDRLVNDRLLAQEAHAIGMDEDPKLLEMLDKRRDKQAASRWVKDHYRTEVTVDDDTVRAYYEENYAQRQFRVIVVRTAEGADSVYTALRGGADMDSLAQAQSIDSYRASGGLRKPTYYYELEPALRYLTDTMSVGGLSAPIPYRSVYAVVRLEQDLPADAAEFDATRPKIESWLTKEEAGRRWDAFVDSLHGLLSFTVDSAGLAEIASDSVNLFTPEFAQGTDRVLLRTSEDKQVTDDDFRTEIGRLAMSSVGLPYQGLYQNTLLKLNEMLVLLSVTYRDGYDQLPEVTESYKQSLDSALVEMYVAQTVLPRITFRRDEFEAYYQEHLADFERPDECQFDRMMIDSAQTAQEVYRLLKDGADFRYVSRQFDTKVATVEESTEWVNVSHLPDTVQKEVNALRMGECTSPQQTGDGWLILRLKDRREGQPATLDEAEPRIREIMFQKKFNAELDKVLGMLKEHSDIQYDEEAIQAYFGSDS